MTVQSPDVDKIAKAGEKTAELVQAGIVVGDNNGQGGIKYKFNSLNALKPDMITEATRNARSSADRFAADSGSQVGLDSLGEPGCVFDLGGRQCFDRKWGWWWG